MVEATVPAPHAGSRLGVLDGFRAIAILLVIGFHYGVRWAPPWEKDASWLPYGEMFTGWVPLQYGRSHACFFFLLSGFVILLTLERCTGVFDFWRKRVARLWPALVLCASLTTLALWIWGPHSWLRDPVSFVLSTLMIDPRVVQPWFPDTQLGWVDGAYWTLAVEARFYLLVSLMFLLPRRWFLPAWLVLQVVSFALAWPAFARAEWAQPLRMILQPTYLAYFTLGICLFEIWRSKRWTGLPLAGALMSLAMLVVVVRFWTRFPHEPPDGRLIVNLFWIGLFLLFVADSPILKPLAFKPLAKLGEASFALFLLHEAAGMALTFAFDGLGIPPLVNLGLVIAVMIAISLVIYRWYEEPAKGIILTRTKGANGWVSRHAPWLDYRSGLTPARSS